MSKINNVFPVTSNIEDMLLNIEQYFDDRRDIDSEVVLIKYGKKHKVELMFGYDVFTRKEDGTVCNSENDAKHYYIEVWNNFYDEEGYHLNDGAPVETFWLDEIDKPVAEILQDAFDVMRDVIEGEYDYNEELDMTKDRMKELLGNFAEHLIECCSDDEEAVEILKNSIGLTEEELEELGFGKDYFAEYDEDNDEE